MSVITPQKNAVNHSEPSLSEKKSKKHQKPTTKLLLEIYHDTVTVFNFKVKTKNYKDLKSLIVF